MLMPMCGFINQCAWYFVSLFVINTKSLLTQICEFVSSTPENSHAYTELFRSLFQASCLFFLHIYFFSLLSVLGEFLCCFPIYWFYSCHYVFNNKIDDIFYKILFVALSILQGILLKIA